MLSQVSPPDHAHRAPANQKERLYHLCRCPSPKQLPKGVLIHQYGVRLKILEHRDHQHQTVGDKERMQVRATHPWRDGSEAAQAREMYLVQAHEGAPVPTPQRFRRGHWSCLDSRRVLHHMEDMFRVDPHDHLFLRLIPTQEGRAIPVLTPPHVRICMQVHHDRPEVHHDHPEVVL